MTPEREQFLLDEIALRDARIVLLEQKLDLLVRRITQTALLAERGGTAAHRFKLLQPTGLLFITISSSL